MTTTPTPHDSFFKDVFGPGKANLPALFSLLDAPFASRIDPASLTFLSGETIGEGLATSFRSDLVGPFFVSDATLDGKPLEVVFLFEHKSSSTRDLPFKLACLDSLLNSFSHSFFNPLIPQQINHRIHCLVLHGPR